jgi:hypothetical protein
MEKEAKSHGHFLVDDRQVGQATVAACCVCWRATTS